MNCGSGLSTTIYAPRFATLVLVDSVGGAYMRDLTFYLANTPSLPVPRLDVDIGTLYYRPIEAARNFDEDHFGSMAMVGGPICGIKIPVQELWLKM